MRIGNLEDLDPASKQKTPEASLSLTAAVETENEKKKKKWKNWWYYYKWYVVCGALLIGIAVSLIGRALGLGVKTPDFQIAYIGKTALPQDTADALEQAFAAIASDYNGDGEVIVRINQYIDGTGQAETDAEAAYYEYASEISLIGDISDCESYFFLMDSPDRFQQEFQLLACADGSCPEETDYSTQDKVIPWTSCPLLAEMELGAYSTVISGETVSGNNQELLLGLYLGRRCFFTDKLTDNSGKCSELWDMLYRAKQ